MEWMEKPSTSGKGLRQKGPLDQFGAVEVFVDDIGLCAEQVAGLFQFLDLFVQTDVPVFQLAGELLLFLFELFLAQGVTDGNQQLVHAVQRLAEEIVSAKANRLNRGLKGSGAGQNDPHGPGAVFLTPLHQAQPVHDGHVEVRHDDIKDLVLQEVFRLGAVGRLGNVELAFLPDCVGHIGAQEPIVIHNQNAGPLSRRDMTFSDHMKPLHCLPLILEEIPRIWRSYQIVSARLSQSVSGRFVGLPMRFQGVARDVRDVNGWRDISREDSSRQNTLTPSRQ